MKIKAEELEGAELDWAVAKCEGRGALLPLAVTREYLPSSSWLQGGPIIAREEISLDSPSKERGTRTLNGAPSWFAKLTTEGPFFYGAGPTPLIAAMRCYVASKLGDEVEVPDGLKGS